MRSATVQPTTCVDVHPKVVREVQIDTTEKRMSLLSMPSGRINLLLACENALREKNTRRSRHVCPLSIVHVVPLQSETAGAMGSGSSLHGLAGLLFGFWSGGQGIILLIVPIDPFLLPDQVKGVFSESVRSTYPVTTFPESSLPVRQYCTSRMNSTCNTRDPWRY
jgi:hypothetical protein